MQKPCAAENSDWTSDSSVDLAGKGKCWCWLRKRDIQRVKSKFHDQQAAKESYLLFFYFLLGNEEERFQEKY